MFQECRHGNFCQRPEMQTFKQQSDSLLPNAQVSIIICVSGTLKEQLLQYFEEAYLLLRPPARTFASLIPVIVRDEDELCWNSTQQYSS